MSIRKELLEPHTITLTKDERRTLPKMGEKSLAFVTNSHDYCKQHPELLPAYFSIEEFTIDVDDATGLLPIKDLLTSTLNLVEDTAMIAGSEAYSQALVFYNNAKVAAKNNIHDAGVKRRSKLGRIQDKKHQSQSKKNRQRFYFL